MELQAGSSSRLPGRSSADARFSAARPTIRPARERHPQPNFVFPPTTPPQTAGHGAPTTATDRRPHIIEVSRLHDSSWTLSQGPSSPYQPIQTFLLEDRNPKRPGIRRALSDSSIRDSASIARESDAGGFKIVITKPGDDRRPKTVEDIDAKNGPLLEILIPSWRLGTPRWSARGTPFIRGSSYAPTEVEFRSGHPSPRSPHFGSSIGRTGSIMIHPARASNAQRSLGRGSGVVDPKYALRSTYMSTHVKIEPAMFDVLTFKPACDDRSIVRYSALSGAVTAATPPRLVAEITSPSFLDYELLSDFFLTFRSFMEPLDLVKMLFARMRWALARDDEIGTVVRVRTFVALRHWILNYFVDDYVCEYEMRTSFCTLMNSLSDEMTNCPKARRVQLKILAELKKCWRRVCAQFWDGPEFNADLPPAAPITPGGIPGHRNPSLDPDFWKQFFHDGPPKLDTLYAPLTSNPPDMETSFARDVAQAGANESSYVITYRPGTRTPEVASEQKDVHQQETQWSPTTLSSVEAVSCSIPAKFAFARSRAARAPHPVDPGSIYTTPDPVATLPRTLTKKRPQQSSHKRNNSTSDSMRGHVQTLEQLIQTNNETILSLPYAGSLVRGNVLPPGQAFVEVVTPSSVSGTSRQTTILRLESEEVLEGQSPPAAMSGHGMRRLISSVRRALSTKGQEMSPTQGNFNIAPIGPRGVTANRLPGSAIVPLARPKAPTNSRPPVRIDLLGAEIVEDFKRVVREDAAEAAARSFHGSVPSTPTTVRSPASQLEFDTAHIDSLLGAASREDNKRGFSDGGVTSGSKSILIFDDTSRVPNEHPTMTGAIPVVNPSVEAFADLLLPGRAEATPPSTPPGRTIDTPRRSSYLLGQHVLRSARSADDLPPFVPDLDSLGGGSSMRSSEYPDRPSMHPRRRTSDFYRQSMSQPPLSSLRRHARHRSSRSNLRKYASFQSGIGRRSTVHSFDDYTDSQTDSMDVSQTAVPGPLRVLRRRPGGDLRAVNNVVELEHGELRRSRSIGSMTTGTFTSSMGTSLIQSTAMVRDSSAMVDVVNSDSSRGRGGIFSLGMMTEKPKARRRISLLSTFSSKPVMRPSFEAEAQKLANIPDDDDDGGVESALARLEGRYVEKKSLKLSMEPINIPLQFADKGKQLSPSQPIPEEDPAVKAEKKKHRRGHVVEEESLPLTPAGSDTQPLPTSLHSSLVLVGEEDVVPNREERVEVRSVRSNESNESFESIPLLERGLTDDGQRSKAEWTNRSILQDPDEGGATFLATDDDDDVQDRTSYDFVRRSEGIEQAKPKAGIPRAARQRGHARNSSKVSQGSFLNMEDTDDDELSSELSEIPFEGDSDSDFDAMAFPTLRPNAPLTKLRTADSRRAVKAEPSPPVEMAQTLARTPQVETIPELRSAQVYGTKPLPPTPEYTPTFGQQGSGSLPTKSSPDPTGVNAALRNATNVIEHEATALKYSAHLPFILAFESEVLAQQFTLIEKDALNEIDWKELIDMRWKNAEKNDARSWVHFLRDTDARGVEVVIARFNIVVKWAISEIVLTQDLEERARSIVKYIHIADHCRRYRNFATMSQIAVALTSGEVGRLLRTWKLVPARDLRTLRELEALISPTRNFYALRAEMEGGGLASAGMGCIPFVGIYTHDLIFNSQRPCEIASSPTTAPLVNFERCRVAAGIVKALLRLLEASTLYSFQPIEGITERCLWMSALSDEDIRKHSESLE